MRLEAAIAANIEPIDVVRHMTTVASQKTNAPNPMIQLKANRIPKPVATDLPPLKLIQHE
jgi:hypothetical protein